MFILFCIYRLTEWWSMSRVKWPHQIMKFHCLSINCWEVLIVHYSNTELMESNSSRHTFRRLKVLTQPYTHVALPHNHQSLRDTIHRRPQDFHPRQHSRHHRCQEITVMLHNMEDHNIVHATVRGKLFLMLTFVWYYRAVILLIHL